MKIIKPALLFMILTAFSAAAWAASGKTSVSMKEHHKDLECADCHGETPKDKYYLIQSEACLSCHGSREETAELTKELDGDNVNPHRSFHSGTATECYECHREHKPSRNFCGNCHDTDLWMKPVP